MGSFRKGDLIVSFEGRQLYLRLTLGALAEICTVLGSQNPRALAEQIKTGERSKVIAIIQALARPMQPEPVDVSTLETRVALDAIADIFEAAFAPLTPPRAAASEALRE